MRFGSTQNLSPNTTALTPELIDFLGQGRTVALLGSTGSIGTQGI